MIEREKVKEQMEVVCGMDENAPIGKVDHVEGNSIKLTKDASGEHHYIPLDWIKSADTKLHLDRSGKDAMTGWTTKPS